MFTKWVRNIHRWLAIPLIIALLATLITTIATGETPNWVATFGVVSILSLLVTGLIMFIQHYLAKMRRARRVKQRSEVPLEA